ncbi:hypothetical protein [Streptomyces anulatus]|uniref:hypothetical protein n=1 Tax=Streptomyces anulatus TaxID=1892 RepID=UPI0037DC7642|nr:hypothetical protein OHB50_38905 [Streptomyces anulatus]
MSLSRPYTYTDGQNHRLAIGTTPDPHGVLHISMEATNLAWGGDSVAVWLTASQARALDSHLAAATPTPDLPAAAGGEWKITDRTDDGLTVTVAHDFTTFEVTRAACEDHGAIAVRVVALTGRLPELRRALGEAIGAAAIVYGAHATNLTVPQVDAALRVLERACQPLAAFRGRLCVDNGAFLDPHTLTGQVTLTYRHRDRSMPGSAAVRATERAQNERSLTTWADLFQAAGWRVDRYQETDRYDGYRLVRLVIVPPAEAVPGRVLTEGEYDSAWHAVEGAAGEEGADPATILHAVLRALDIATPPRTT